MTFSPYLNCDIQTTHEIGYTYIQIGINQENMLLAYFLFDTLMSGFSVSIGICDQTNSSRFTLSLASSPPSDLANVCLALTPNDISCIKKLLYDCINNKYNVSWQHVDITLDGKDGITDIGVHIIS